MAFGQHSRTEAGSYGPDVWAFFSESVRSGDPETAGTDPRLARRFRTLPLLRACGTAMRSPSQSGWLLPTPSTGHTHDLCAIPNAQETGSVLNRSRDAMARVDQIFERACSPVALAPLTHQMDPHGFRSLSSILKFRLKSAHVETP